MSALRDLIPKNAVLLPIDMQEGFYGAGRPRLNFEPDVNGLRLIAAWRARGWPIIHVRHDSVMPGSVFRPGQPGNALRPGFAPGPGEALVSKSVNAAFIGTDLELRIRRLGAQAMVAFGISADQCVSTSVRVGANLGLRMIVASDATAAFDQPGLDGVLIPAATVHAVHLATLANEFAEVATTDAILGSASAT